MTVEGDAGDIAHLPLEAIGTDDRAGLYRAVAMASLSVTDALRSADLIPRKVTPRSIVPPRRSSSAVTRVSVRSQKDPAWKGNGVSSFCEADGGAPWGAVIEIGAANFFCRD